MSRRDLPLAGVAVVVTRARAQAAVLTSKLTDLGADVIEIATIKIEAPLDGGAALRKALANPSHYGQIVVASPNGARALIGALESLPSPVPDVLPPVACVGPSTAALFVGSKFSVNLVPDRAVAEGLVEAMSPPAPGQDQLLLVQAEVARDVLEQGLTALGWEVDRVVAYRTVDADVSDEDRARASTGDVITFTSSSTVERFVRLVGRDEIPSVIASIGPITSTTARDLGLEVRVEADPHTIDGLVDAVVGWAATRPCTFPPGE